MWSRGSFSLLFDNSFIASFQVVLNMLSGSLPSELGLLLNLGRSLFIFLHSWLYPDLQCFSPFVSFSMDSYVAVGRELFRRSNSITSRKSV